MSEKFNKRRHLIRQYQYETNRVQYYISSNNEFLFKVYNTDLLDQEARVTTDIPIYEQLENMEEMEKLIYEDQINKEFVKFKRKS